MPSLQFVITDRMSLISPLNSNDRSISLKVAENEKNGGSRRRQMLGNGGDQGLFTVETLKMQFLIKNLTSFFACNSKINTAGDYFDIKRCFANNDAMTHRGFLRQWRCGSNSQRELLTRGFFIVQAASSFTLRRFGAQIN